MKVVTYSILSLLFSICLLFFSISTFVSVSFPLSVYFIFFIFLPIVFVLILFWRSFLIRFLTKVVTTNKVVNKEGQMKVKMSSQTIRYWILAIKLWLAFHIFTRNSIWLSFLFLFISLWIIWNKVVRNNISE